MIEILLVKRREIAFFIFSLLVLVANFQVNFFHSASDGFFEKHELGSESLVIGRLAQTQQHGFISANGFLGRLSGADPHGNQFDVYTSGVSEQEKFNEYRSSAGFQGFFYGVLDKLYPALGVKDATHKYELHRFLTSLALSLTLSFFLLFVYKEFGLFSSFFTLVMLGYSQWVVVFGDNLYWMASLIFLPFVVVMLVLKSEEKDRIEKSSWLFSLLFVSVFLKLLAGYEFVSTIFISMTIPIFYFAIKNRWSLRRLSRRFAGVSIIGIVALIVALLIHFWMVSMASGSAAGGVETIKNIVLKRTYGNADAVGEIYRQSLESSVFEVILRYWNGRAFDLYSAFAVGGYITFGQVVIFLIALSVLTTLLIKTKLLRNVEHSKYYALLATLWLSLLAPLSWYVLAKGHSFIHIFINQILWYVPFLILAFVFTGYSLFLMFLVAEPLWVRRKVKACFYIGVLIVGVIGVQKFVYANYSQKESYIKNTNFLAVGPGSDGIQVGLYGDSLVFLSPTCEQEVLKKKFFVHILPVQVADLPKDRIQYKYGNADFNWYSQPTLGPSLFGEYKEYCLALVKAPRYIVAGVRTGQFTREGRLWEVNINLFDYKTETAFTAFKLTDRNWQNGIHRTAAAFFLESSFDLRQSLQVGKSLVLPGSGVRKIKAVSYSGPYINVFLEGTALDFTRDGWPNEIRMQSTVNGSE